MSKPRVIFAGTPAFSVPVLEKLLDLPVDVVAVYCQPDRPAGRGRKPRQCPVKECALQHELTVRQPITLRDETTQQELADFHADLMVVVAYGLILPPAVLTTPRLGCVNIHASLLPRWRGAAPIQRAIQAGDEQTGITLMQMDEGLDTGDMLATCTTGISDGDTSASLHDRLSAMGAELLGQNLNALLNGSLQAMPQNHDQASYAAKIIREEARLDWSKSAICLQREIRAFNPWPGSFAQLGEKQIKIWSARLTDTPADTAVTPGTILAATPDGIRIGCGEGVLNISELQKPGSRRMSCGDFLNGTPLMAGDILG